jgi:hypothetical protein
VISGASDLESEFSVFFLLLALPQTLFSGMLLGCLAVGVTRLVRGIPFFVHPGQWLATLWGMTTVGGWLVLAVYSLATDPAPMSWAPVIFYVANMLIHVLFATGCAAAVIQGRFDRRWNAVLIVVAVQEVLAAAAGLVLFCTMFMNSTLPNSPLIWVLAGTAITALSALILLPLLVAAAVGDRRRRITRDWMHWVGALGIVWKTAAAWMVLIGNLAVLAVTR